MAAGSKVELQVAFLYQFTNYIEWPTKLQSGDFVIGVAGGGAAKAGLLQHLETLASERKVAGRSIVVRDVGEGEPLSGIHLIILGGGDSKLLASIARRSKGAPCVIVAEIPGSAEKGASIGFFEERGRLRFEINRKEIEQRGLRVDSRLLGLARVVE